MKKTSAIAKAKARLRNEILVSCEETRRQCSAMSDEQRQRLREEALRMIYGHDAKAPARSR